MPILFVLSSHDTLSDTGHKTGTWLEELLVPYYLFVDAGHEVVIASPCGGAVPIDPASVSAYEGQPLLARFEADGVLQGKLAASATLADLAPADFDGVIYPGGHGPLFDLRYDVASQAMITTTLAAGRPVGVICHAGCVLVDLKGPDGEALVKGKTITGFTDAEEAAVNLTDAVPYSVEQELRALGANYIPADLWAANVQVDGPLVTGQNPASAGPVAAAMLEMLAR